MSSSTSTYDPDRHDNQIVAMYETDMQARAARDALVSSGVPQDAIQVVARGGDLGMAGTSNTGTSDTGSGMWDAVRSLFVPDDERSSYTHAIGHGHAMLVVTPTGTVDRSAVIHTLEGTDPIDFDAKLQAWNESGYDHRSLHPDYVASTQNAGGSTTMGATTGPTAGGTANSMAADKGLGMASTAASDAGYDTRMAATPATPATTAAPVVPAMATTPAPATTAKATSLAAAPMPGNAALRDAATIQVVDEQLRVGKREVAAGAVRVRSYIVERPVEERVHLREEHITLDRQAVDRPVDGTVEVTVFQERVIEARAMSEQAVVSKEARVVEEIGLRKDATERVETVRDTVRHTEVEVEDSTKANPQNVPAIPPRP